MPYAVIRKKRRLHNPGKRRKKMTAKQIRFFGTKAQRAGLKRRRRPNTSIRKFKKRMKARASTYKWDIGKSVRTYKARGRARKRRKRNVGSILVASIPGMNPGGRKHKMARRRKRIGKRATARRRHRRHSNPVARRRRSYRRHHARTRVVYRSRRHNRGRRRNPGGGGMGGDFQAVAGILSGAAVTSIVSGLIPAAFSTGIVGYIATGVIAMLQGQFIGKALKKPQFGKLMTYGGFTYVGLKIINDMMPSLGGYLPFGLSGGRGFGVISPSQGFSVPQVNRWGSMGSFIPNGLLTATIAASAPKASGMHGIGEGSVSTRRVGRVQ